MKKHWKVSKNSKEHQRSGLLNTTYCVLRRLTVWSGNLAWLALIAISTSCTTQQYIQVAVDAYCDMPTEQRMLNRQAVAIAVAPHYISINCAGD